MRLPELFLVALLHGPAELLPISSSAHVGLLLADLDPEERKELEVAVHAGTLFALGPPRPAAWLIAATLPPALAGALFERRIERLGPRWTAFGLIAGGLAMALADTTGTVPPNTRGQSRFIKGDSPPSAELTASSPKFQALNNPGSDPLTLGVRPHNIAGSDPTTLRGQTPLAVWEGLVVGLAQACALVPGVSRHGAALTALRALGHGRAEAHALSREASKPVLAGAVALKGWRVVRRRGPIAAPVVAALGSFLSTRVALRVVGAPPLWPFAIYRAALAGSVLRRV
jgi:undecaprenyl-diphosphatase